MNEKYKGKKIETSLTEKVFDGYDFTETIFMWGAFENNCEKLKFTNCLFDKTVFGIYESEKWGVRYSVQPFYNCKFLSCKFIKIDMRLISFHENTTLDGCHFLRCDFRVDLFGDVNFKNDVFEKCKYKFKSSGALFENSKFIGKLSEVKFEHKTDRNLSRVNEMKNIDFSEAILGDYVSFDNIDMKNCIPPKGRTWEELLYQFLENDPSSLSTGDKDRTVISAATLKWIEDLNKK